jgi:hypothetical protein
VISALVGAGLGVAWRAADFSGDFQACVPFVVAAVTGALLAASELGLLRADDDGNGGDGGDGGNGGNGWTLERVAAVVTIAGTVCGIVESVLKIAGVVDEEQPPA